MQLTAHMECRRPEIIWVWEIFCSDNCIHYKFSIIDTLVPLAPTLGSLVRQMQTPWPLIGPKSLCWSLIGRSWDEMHIQDSSRPRLCLIDFANCEKLFIQMLLLTIHHHTSRAWQPGRACEGSDLEGLRVRGTHAWKHKVALGDIDLAIRTRNHN